MEDRSQFAQAQDLAARLLYGQIDRRTFLRRALAEFVATLNRLIDKENMDRATIFITRKLAICWREGLAPAALAKAVGPSLTPQALGDLLDGAMRWNADGAGVFAVGLLA